MLGLERTELVEQRVVPVVPDLGIIQDVVAVAVVLDRAPELGGAPGRVPRLLGDDGAYGSITSLAAGLTSRSRS
jgi:hypothetical protein